MVKIGLRISRFRKSKGYTQEQFAKKIGVSKPSLLKFEKGEIENIPLGVAINIAKELDVDFGELFEIEGYGNIYKAKEAHIKVLEDSEEFLEKQVKELQERLKERKETIELLQSKIDIYKKFVFISAHTYITPYINKIDAEIELANTENERLKLIDRKKKFYEGVDSLFELYVDMGLLTKEEIEKFRKDEDGIYFSILKENKSDKLS